MEFTECNMSEAIKMASTNPAKMFSLNHLGSLTIGKRADLIVFSRVGNKIEIHKTFVNGVEVYSKSEYLGAN
jgi:N-acetylglucosamine-6-phosphate deacetylase